MTVKTDTGIPIEKLIICWYEIKVILLREETFVVLLIALRILPPNKETPYETASKQNQLPPQAISELILSLSCRASITETVELLFL